MQKCEKEKYVRLHRNSRSSLQDTSYFGNLQLVINERLQKLGYIQS